MLIFVIVLVCMLAFIIPGAIYLNKANKMQKQMIEDQKSLHIDEEMKKAWNQTYIIGVVLMAIGCAVIPAVALFISAILS
jgi:hypothetical protein